MKNFWKNAFLMLFAFVVGIFTWEKVSNPEKVITIENGDNIESQEQTNNIKQKKSSGTQETTVTQTDVAPAKKRKPVLSFLKKKKKI